MMRREILLLGDLGDILEDPSKPLPLPDPKALPNGGWPPAAKPSKQAWSRGDGTYVLQRGDTISGLAKTYLGQYTRWREIWSVQTPEYLAKHKSADKVYEGEILQMPDAAKQKARELGLLRDRAWIKWAVGAAAAVGVVGAGVIAIGAARA